MDSSIINKSKVTPIAALNPYFHNQWVLKVKIATKSPIRDRRNDAGGGRSCQTFSVILLDESGSIRAVLYRSLVAKYYNSLEVGQMYYITRGEITSANKWFNGLNNAIELVMNSESVIVPCNEPPSKEDLSWQVDFSFTRIQDLHEMAQHTVVDVIGILLRVDELLEFTDKKGIQRKKRDASLMDQFNRRIKLTLWENNAENLGAKAVNSVIALKAAWVQRFEGRNVVTTNDSTIVQMNPDIPEALELRRWFCRTRNIPVESKVVSIPTVTIGQLDNKGSRGSYKIKGTIVTVFFRDCIYKSCLTEGCKKKLGAMGNRFYKCEKCNRKSPFFKYRWSLCITVMDHTGSLNFKILDTEADKLIGQTAQQLAQLYEHDRDKFEFKVKQALLFKTFNFIVKTNEEKQQNGWPKAQRVIEQIISIKYRQSSQELLAKIRQMTKLLNK